MMIGVITGGVVLLVDSGRSGDVIWTLTLVGCVSTAGWNSIDVDAYWRFDYQGLTSLQVRELLVLHLQLINALSTIGRVLVWQSWVFLAWWLRRLPFDDLFDIGTAELFIEDGTFVADLSVQYCSAWLASEWRHSGLSDVVEVNFSPQHVVPCVFVACWYLLALVLRHSGGYFFANIYQVIVVEKLKSGFIHVFLELFWSFESARHFRESYK